jgi:4-hydroxybenzoate polyprenyltransferase
VAVTGDLPLAAWLLGGAVAAWVAGFDVLYALFDLEVDRRQGLHSFPARFGIRGTFWMSRALHAATVALLALAGAQLPVGGWYSLAVAAVAVLLLYEQLLVSPDDQSRLNTAFFTMNGVTSLVFFVFVLADVVS